MSGPPIPGDDKERRIFIAALRDYRNGCEPPALTPNCPYFTWTADGPACGEECADIIAHHEPEEEHGEIDLGAGIVITRRKPPRRPRRGPDASDRPFDPRRIYFADRDRPHDQRRTTALCVEVDRLVLSPPSLWEDSYERTYDIAASIGILESRGFSADSFVRYGIGAKFPIVLGGFLLMALAKEAETYKDAPDLPEGWMQYVTASANDILTVTGENDLVRCIISPQFMDSVRDWVDSAPIEDIFNWKAPEWPYRTSHNSIDPRERQKAIWLCERFTEPYVKDWQLSSLHLEWLYAYGRLAVQVSSSAMAESRTNLNSIAQAIAEQTTDEWRRKKGDFGPSIVGEFVGSAVEHLKEGRAESAAAIFEAITKISPGDAEAHNNLGFCLLPVNVESALKELDKAHDLYDGSSLTTIANRALAMHVMGRDSEAVELIKPSAIQDLPSLNSYLWELTDAHELKLTETTSVRGYCAGLLTHINNCERG